MYINKLADIANDVNNTYHNTIKMKSADVKSGTCIVFNVENDDKVSKFKVEYCVRISKYKNLFAKD